MAVGAACAARNCIGAKVASVDGCMLFDGGVVPKVTINDRLLPSSSLQHYNQPLRTQGSECGESTQQLNSQVNLKRPTPQGRLLPRRALSPVCHMAPKRHRLIETLVIG